jgi:phospholipase C
MTNTRDRDPGRLTRRDVLQGVGAMVGTAAIGCSDDDAGNQSQTPAVNLSPEQLLKNIDAIVVVMMENRAFDHYYGAYELVEGRKVDGLTGNESNPAPDGSTVTIGPITNFTTDPDPPHNWEQSHGQFNGGSMDGFATEYEKDSPGADLHAVMSYYTRTQLPVSYALADAYSLCNRWFASVMGPTWPNRYYLHCATSGGMMANQPIHLTGILDALDAAGIPCGYYASSLPFAAAYGYANTGNMKTIDAFYTAAAEGTLPALSFVDPIFTALDTIGNDDHPPADVRDGQAFLASIHDALAQSPQWNRCLFVVTYDEHGGFYDHVLPPETDDDLPEFRQLGFRVPSLVIGPHVKRGALIDTSFEHSSVIATVTRKFGLEPLNARVAATSDLSSAIDPRFVDNPQPAAALPAVELDLERPLLHPGRNFGGQVELARLSDSLRIDWRQRARLARRAIDANALRLGSIRARSR